ncbi:MAG TPA: hypothetical protein VLK58_07610 [Conexibacter sp.]|nr:hypothetical protein [Conexibacter sp.]
MRGRSRDRDLGGDHGRRRGRVYRWPTVTRDDATVVAARGNDLLVGPNGVNPAERRAG